MRLAIGHGVSFDEGYLVSVVSSPSGCDHSWFTWHFAAAGFCWRGTDQYFVQQILLSADLAESRVAALRALTYANALRQHSFPELLNAATPAAELSEFERKTIFMLALRARTEGTWPDLDRIR